MLRELAAAEQHISVEQIDTLLNSAKDELELAIVAEQRRLARGIAAGRGGRLRATPAMRKTLDRLRAAGRAHALAELDSMGYLPARRHATPPRRTPRTKQEADAKLQADLDTLTVKIHRETLGLSLGDYAASAVERAAIRILGARSIAADLVSPVFVSGLADTFEHHQELVQAWQYTAINDAGLCDACAPWDGEIFENVDDLFSVLPNFGPNPDCQGGDRCRCRAVPVPPDASTDRLAA